MLARIARFAPLCLLAITLSAFTGNAQAVPSQPAARTIQYSQTDIIPIRAKVRFSTLIILPRNEEILDATTGDKEFWIINGSHNLCYLHPAKAGIRSNLNLITSSGHVYSFLLTEISNEPKAEPDLKVFIKRKDDPSSAEDAPLPQLVPASELDAYENALQSARRDAAQKIEAAQQQALREVEEYRDRYPATLTFDYTYSASAAEPPFSVSAIYHDGKFTYIKSTAEEKPTIYELKDGKPSLINFDLTNGLYVIPKILDEGYLAVGKKKLKFVRRVASS